MKIEGRWVAAMVLSLAVAAAAEEKTGPPEKKEPPKAPAVGDVQRVVSLNNPELAPAIADVLGAFPFLQVRWNKDLGVIVLSGRASAVEAAADAIRGFDPPAGKKPATPARNIDFTAHLLIARAQDVKGTPLPAELAPVVEQLRGLFQYGEYELLDTIALRTAERTGESWIDGAARSAASGGTKTYDYSFRLINPALAGEDEKGRTVRVGRLSLNLQVRSGGTPKTDTDPGEAPKSQKISIATALDIREGQKVVVGKAALDSNEALILVLSAKTMQ